MKYDDTLWEHLEHDPDILALKSRMRDVEDLLRAAVSDEHWAVFLEWEALWAQYVTLYVERLYPLVLEKGRRSAFDGGSISQLEN